MKVYLTDGTSFECGGYKALDSGGVVLTSDKKRKHVVGYVPADALVYVLPDDVAPGDSLAEEGDGDDAGEEGDDDEGRESDDAGDVPDAADDGDEHETGESETEGHDSRDPDQTTVEAEVDPDVAGVTTVADGETEHTHADLAARIDEVESRVDGLDGRVDAMTEQLATVVSAGGVGAEAAAEEARDPEDPRNIRGIGEAYANRLRAAGIDTVSALREASDEELAAAADVSARRVADWKRRAERYAEQQTADGDTEPESDVDTERDIETDAEADETTDDEATGDEMTDAE
ncbi:helix-hairpin-helix domain-containing protein [Haloferax marisrubri]|uniref:Helix-hairpin-helix domain-containing protein n=1 Tax=Haloferax marisrubri TaxID=1544719 RepID=A0A2P4NRA4_9EURY|nr:helix-hairpin-helix domain-containing protein [Haloferax marisrubri]POG55660.1 helix-hairpin-helix domain-containing protein [Haloferax marisrubri]